MKLALFSTKKIYRDIIKDKIKSNQYYSLGPSVEKKETTLNNSVDVFRPLKILINKTRLNFSRRCKWTLL